MTGLEKHSLPSRFRKNEDKIIITMNQSKSKKRRKPPPTSNDELRFKPKVDDVCQDTHLNNPLHNMGLVNTIRDIVLNSQVSDLSHNRAVNRFDMLRILEAAGVEKSKLCDLELDPQCLLQRLHSVGVSGEGPAGDHVNLLKHMKVASLLTELTSHQFLPSKVLESVKSLKAPETHLPHHLILVRYHALRSRLEQGVILTAKPGRHSLRADLEAYAHWATVRLAGEQRGGRVFTTEIEGFGKIFLTPRHLVIKASTGTWLGTRDHYLMLHDCIAQRWVCLLAVALADLFNQQNYPSLSTVLEVLDWGDELLNRFGNDGYAAIKVWESLLYGLIMASEDDPVVDSQLFLSNMEADIYKSIEGDDGFVELHWKGLKKDCLSRQSLHQLSQLHGLYRIWGHPSIDILDGLFKLRQIACTPRLTCYTSVHYQRVSWREQFCVGYYNTEHKWPCLRILESMPQRSLLRKCLESGSPLPLNSPQYELDDWAHIVFEKTFQVPAKFDLNSTTKDSATSLGFEDLKDRLTNEGHIGSAAERSVILRFLAREWTSPEAFLKKIDETGFDPDEKVIGLREKERELSSSGRFFGLLPIEKRLYVVVTEAMIAEELLHYVPEITMTYNQVKLREHIQRATRKLKSQEEDTVTVVTNMDFVKWNSNMREEETKPLFEDIDNLFGFTNLVSRTYEMFSESQMYLANGHHNPEVDEKANRLKNGPTVWDGHKGGVEGLRQKGWTLFTVSLIKRVARLLGLNCTLMGQGDNQVLITTYTKHPEKSYREQHSDFISVLTRCLSSIGPPLKPEETWSSSHLFSYGKYAVWKGAPLSNSLKMVVKLARMTNEGLQNIASTLSSITANCTAATDVDISPLIAYIICALESSVAVELSLSRPFFSESSETLPSNMKHFRIPSSGVSTRISVERDDRVIQQVSRFTLDGLLMLLIAPSSLGGYPVCHYWGLLMHGFPDQLSIDVQGLKAAYLYTTRPLIKLIISRLLFPPFNADINPVMLCQDPYSLNLLHGSSSVDKVKGMVLDYLVTHGGDFIKNEHFLDFLRLAVHDQEQLGMLLYKCDPLHPRVCNAIMESTIVGKVNQALAKVTKTGVLINLMLKYTFKAVEEIFVQMRLDQYDEVELPDSTASKKVRRTFFELFGLFEQNQLNCLIHTLCVSQGSIDKEPIESLCSYLHTKALRDISWGKSVEGVTVAVPWELLQSHLSTSANCDLDDHPCQDGGYIMTTLVGTTDPEFELGRSGHIAMGPMTPYLGKGTKNKVDYEAKKLAEQSPSILRNALSLLQLIGWATDRESKLSELIVRLIGSVTDVPARQMIPLQEEIAGTFEHRFDDVKTARTCTSSIIPTGASYILSNTNHFTPELVDDDLGTDNLHMQFQSLFLFIQHYFSVNHVYCGYPKETTTYHWHIKCRTCVYPIKEQQIELQVEEVDWETFNFLEKQPQNPYLWVPAEALPKQLIPTRDWGQVHSIPQESTYEDVEDLLVQAMVAEIMRVHWLISPSFRSRQSVSTFEFSVSIVAKLPFVTFIQELIYSLFLRLCWIRASMLEYHDRYQSILPWINGHLNTLREVDLSWFEPFHRLLEHPENLSRALRRWPLVSPPIGSPPQKNQVSTFFQELFRREIDDPSFIDRFRSWCHPEHNKHRLQILQHGLNNHPASKWALSTLLAGNTDDRIWYFTRFLKKEAALFSDMKVTSISDLTFLAQMPDRVEQHLDTLTVKFAMERFLNLDPNPRFVVGTRDGISAALSPRVRPEMIPLPEVENPRSLELPRVHGCKLLLEVNGRVHPDSLTESVGRVLPDWDMSVINHLFKPYKTPTTAHYKLLSVLSFCYNSQIPLPGGDNIRLFGVADGDGGFCQLLHRIWPTAEVVFNSLYDVTKMSPTGASSVRPSSVYGLDSLVRRVVGLKLIEEGLSDLTDMRTLNALTRNFPHGDLLVCDAEGEGINSPEKELSLAKQVALLSHRIDCPLVVYKTYSKSLAVCFSVVNIWLSSYDSVKIIRSPFSGYGNTELYLVISNRLTLKRRLPTLEFSNENLSVIIGNFRSNCSWMQFSSELAQQADYTSVPHLLSDIYTFTLTPVPIQSLWKQELSNIINKFSGGRKFKFPDTFIRALNQQYAPVTLARSSPSTWVVSYFTPSVKTEIFSHFCICWGISILVYNNSPAAWSEWVNSLRFMKLLCYQTVSGGWSLWPMMPGDAWPSLSACVLISNLDITEAARKHIVSTMGKYKFNPSPDLQNITQEGFSEGTPAWTFSKIAGNSVPPIFPVFCDANYSVPWSWAPIPCFEWVDSNPGSEWFYPRVEGFDRIAVLDNYYRLKLMSGRRR